jgi:hypothetical protein
MMQTFVDLVASRRAWVEDVLRPWCRQARLRELLQAEADWPDIAGRVDPHATLWAWAWERFPELVGPASSLDETRELCVVLRDGRTVSGYPDGRQSLHGKLVLLSRSSDQRQIEELGPFPIDDIVAVTACR